MESKQTLIFRLYQVLSGYSDADHPLTQQKIIDILSDEYDLVVERKAIGRNVSYLKEMGFEIEGDKKGIYLASRPFENAELRLLIDSVLSSSHINATYSKQLIDKLILLGGKYFKAHVKHVYSVRDWNKTQNRDLFLNVDLVDEAIENEKQLVFDYNKMGADKKLHRTAHHKVSPYQMLLHNQHYYLMAYNEKQFDVAFYRMDKITDMQISDDVRTPLKSVPGYKNGIDYKELSTARPYMFADKPERVVIKLPERLIDDIIDWFGADIKVKSNKSGILTVEIVASPNAMQFWAMQYGTYAEIIEPQSLREKIKERLTKMQENYSK